MPPRRRRSPDPYRDAVVQRVAARAPLGFGIFIACVAISTFFEVVHFPDRRGWMAAFAATSVLLVGGGWTLIQRRPARAAIVLLCFVNAVGVLINVYHVIVGASLPMCVWALTGLLCTSAVVLPWGSRPQALAAVGTLISYPLHLEASTADPLTWGAGGVYLLVVVSLSVFGASLFARYLRTDLELSAALSEREARLQSYFDLALVGTAILAPDGVCIEVNDELCRMLGYGRAELLGRPWLELVHPEERAAAAGLLERAARDAGAPQCHDQRWIRRDGERIHASVSLRGLPGPYGATDHFMLLVQDVTERRMAEADRERYLARVEAARQHAEDASRAKDAFLATVSHELRTPLTSILAWTSLLREGTLRGEDATAALAAIVRNTRAQTKLVDDLLDVSRVLSGEWRMTVRPTALTPVIQAALDLMRPTAEAKGVAIECTLPATPAVWVRGDPDRLTQVVSNLLSNAVKFTPPGGHVQVTVAGVAGLARIVVRDTGAGIHPAFLPQVFEPFRQADGSPTRRHGGVGLGLAIVRALVRLHGGTVRAESAGPGRGATFTVELPRAPAGTKVAAAGEEAEVVCSSLDGLHVLVVDDDADVNRALGLLLGSLGAEVRTSLSTPEALEIAGTWQPDVLVSDIAMPGEDGYALLRQLRARGGSLAKVPAVALTAYAGSGERLRLLAAGFDAHVAKPCEAAELASTVLRVVNRAAKPV